MLTMHTNKAAKMLLTKTLWELRVLVEVGLALFKESTAALLCFVKAIVEHRGIAGKFLNASLPVEFSIEASLDHTQCKGRTFHHRLSPKDALVFELCQRHHLVDKPHLEGFLCVVLPTEEPNLAGLLLADDARQIARAEACIERAYLWTGLSENGVLAGNAQVADNMQHVSSADGVAVDHCNDGLGQTADLHLHIQHAEPWNTLLVDIASMPLHVHVATRAEGMLDILQPLSLGHLGEGTREDDDAQVEAVAAVVERLREFPRGEWRERVSVAPARM